eukprot:SAG31_NODE_1837_length_7126_cov_8.278497_3_plen_100_part_00
MAHGGDLGPINDAVFQQVDTDGSGALCHGLKFGTPKLPLISDTSGVPVLNSGRRRDNLLQGILHVVDPKTRDDLRRRAGCIDGAEHAQAGALKYDPGII